MNNNHTKLISNSIIYTISGLLLKGLNIFLLPLYTAYLSTDDFGVINITNTFTSVMLFVVAFSLYTSISRFYVEYKDEPEKLKRFYGSVFLFTFFSSVITLIIFIVL